jgi:SAM-dependent methyltransferase
MGKTILDVCCGGRMFWFDKSNPSTLFVDKRVVGPISVGKGRNARMFSCGPDKVMDFRKLDLPDESFHLVVFDPPHFVHAGDNSYMVKKYGKLDQQTWREDLRKGFSECFRVLKSNGVLVFKWNEYQIPLSEVLKLAPMDPLFGHPSGKTQRTHWVCFMKTTKSVEQSPRPAKQGDKT